MDEKLLNEGLDDKRYQEERHLNQVDKDRNGVIDTEERDRQNPNDLNNNGIDDELERDSDGNGVPDRYEDDELCL